MLLLNKTLLKLARGLWGDILAIAAVSFLALVGSTALSEIVAGFLGSLFAPADALSGAGDALRAALSAAAATFAAQLLKGLLEYRTAAARAPACARPSFPRSWPWYAGGIEQIGPTAAITASVDAVEQMQSYYSIYLPNLFYSIAAPVYLFFRLKRISLPVAVLMLVVSLVLLPANNLFRRKIEQIRRRYWRALEDMTGYYLDSLRGLTTLKLFDRDREHSRVLGEKADILNRNINAFMKINFTSFLSTEALIYASICTALALCSARLHAAEAMPIAQALSVLMLSYSYFAAIRQLMSASHGPSPPSPPPARSRKFWTWTPPAPMTPACRATRHSSTASAWRGSPMATPGARGRFPTSRSTSRAERRSRSSGYPVAASRRSPRCSCGSAIPHRGGSTSRAAITKAFRPRKCGGISRSCRSRSASSQAPSATTCCSRGRTRRTPRFWMRCPRRGCSTLCARSRTGWTRRSETPGRPVRRAAPKDGHRPRAALTSALPHL